MIPLLLLAMLITLPGAWSWVVAIGGPLLVLLIIVAVLCVVLMLLAELWERLTETPQEKAIRLEWDGHRRRYR